MRSSNQVSVLLGSAAYGGTIAAVRCLGDSGFNVNVISSARLAPAAAAWSRYVNHSYLGPRENDSRAFLDRLLAIGARNPGQVLLPTSDETAWLYTENAAELGRFFCLYQPSLETIRRILDKKSFADAAIAAGLATLPSWEPKTAGDVAKLARDLPYPILIKRRTHVHHSTNHKGILVRSPSELMRQYERFEKMDAVGSGEGALREASPHPFLQQFVDVVSEGVCSVSGFIDRTGELFVTRRLTKVFQRSQPVGVGVCFESLPSDPALAAAVRRLCTGLGYFGMFEAEFLRFKDSWAVIDFNPRLFNQVGMDIRRGMPLPLLACLDAVGDSSGLREAVARAQVESEGSKAVVFCDVFTLRAILVARALTQRISRKELAYWRAWLSDNVERTVDVARDRGDPGPGVVHAISEICLGLRAIPKFLRFTPRISESADSPSAEARS